MSAPYCIPLTKKLTPALKEWPKKSSNDKEQHRKWAEAGYNFGIDTGKTKLIVVDLDVKNGPNGIKSWQELCAQNGGEPETYTVQTKSGGLHLYFKGKTRCSTSAHNGLGPGIDIRSQGGYVVCPPSPGYKVIKEIQILDAPQWLKDRLPLPKSEKHRDDSDQQIVPKDDPIEVERAESAMQNLTPPEKGNRNNFLYELALGMRDRGLSEEKIAEILTEYNDKHNLEQDGAKIANNAYQYAEGKVGSKSISEFQDVPQPETPKKKTREKKPKTEDTTDLEPDPSKILVERMTQMNKEWCTALGHGRLHIFRQENDARGYKRYTSYEKASFVDYHENDELEIQTPNGVKAKNAAKIWLGWKKRRNYSKGYVFDPTNTCGTDYLNLWQGWAVEPEPGDWSLLRNHIYENIAMADGPEHAEEHFNYLMNWMAHLVQYPADLPGVALVLRGGKGCGKSIIGDHLCYIAGAHGQNGSGGQHLTTQFNAYMEECVFCLVNEITWAGDKEGQEILKDRITSPVLRIEPKGKDAYFVNNFMHLLITSNANWVIPATPDERRYAVFNVLPTHQDDEKFWNMVIAQMKNGGLKAMLYELKNRDIGKWKPRHNIPQTEALREQIVSSLNPAQRFLADLIENGEVPMSWVHPSVQNGDWQDNPQIIIRDEMALDFQMKAGMKNLQSAQIKLGQELKRMKTQERYQDFQTQQRVDGQRIRFHVLPPLSDPVWDSLRGQ